MSRGRIILPFELTTVSLVVPFAEEVTTSETSGSASTATLAPSGITPSMCVT